MEIPDDVSVESAVSFCLLAMIALAIAFAMIGLFVAFCLASLDNCCGNFILFDWFVATSFAIYVCPRPFAGGAVSDALGGKRKALVIVASLVMGE